MPKHVSKSYSVSPEDKAVPPQLRTVGSFYPAPWLRPFWHPSTSSPSSSALGLCCLLGALPTDTYLLGGVTRMTLPYVRAHTDRHASDDAGLELSYLRGGGRGMASSRLA